jgi:hypothetical protein
MYTAINHFINVSLHLFCSRHLHDLIPQNSHPAKSLSRTQNFPWQHGMKSNIESPAVYSLPEIKISSPSTRKDISTVEGREDDQNIIILAAFLLKIEEVRTE